MIFCTFVASL